MYFTFCGSHLRFLPFALRVELVIKRASTASKIPRTISTREHVSAEMDLFYGPQMRWPVIIAMVVQALEKTWRSARERRAGDAGAHHPSRRMWPSKSPAAERGFLQRSSERGP